MESVWAVGESRIGDACSHVFCIRCHRNPGSAGSRALGGLGGQPHGGERRRSSTILATDLGYFAPKSLAGDLAEFGPAQLTRCGLVTDDNFDRFEMPAAFWWSCVVVGGFFGG